MNSKKNELFNEIIQIASQAILTDDERIKDQAFADIEDAIASIVPVDHAKGMYQGMSAS